MSQRDFLGLPTATEMEKQDGDYQVWLTYRRWKEFSEDDKSFSAIIKAVGKHKVFSSKWDSYLLKYKTSHAWSSMKESEQVDKFFDESLVETVGARRHELPRLDPQAAGALLATDAVRPTRAFADRLLPGAARVQGLRLRRGAATRGALARAAAHRHHRS